MVFFQASPLCLLIFMEGFYGLNNEGAILMRARLMTLGPHVKNRSNLNSMVLGAVQIWLIVWVFESTEES